MIKLVFFISVAIFSTISLELYQIERLFLQNYARISSMKLPQITQQNTLESELAEFTQLHQTDQFINFNADPEFSAQILLKQENNWNQSIYLSVRQPSDLLLQIKVTHKLDAYQFDNQSIDLHVISLQKGEVIYSSKIKHLKLAKINVESDLYEVRVAFSWKSKEKNNSQIQEMQKHIKIDTDIITTAKKAQKGQNSDEKRANQKLKFIKNESDRIFMSSLQIWDQVQSHHQQHFANQQEVYLRAYIQIIGVFLINVIELMALKKTLKIQSFV